MYLQKKREDKLFGDFNTKLQLLCKFYFIKATLKLR